LATIENMFNTKPGQYTTADYEQKMSVLCNGVLFIGKIAGNKKIQFILSFLRQKSPI